MPLDKARIQGFGSDGPGAEKTPVCPEGHELQLWAARSGKCDSCGKKVQTGEQVMDCRRCNWYLCNVCCPQTTTQESTLWGAISSLPFYVLDDMSEMATDIETFVSASVFDQDKEGDGQGKSSSQSEAPVSPRQKTEATQIVTEFCEKYPAVRVVPNEADLDVFWAKCSVLHPRPIADAVYDQLSFSGGDLEWQPRLRALYALEHLHNKGGMGKEITKMVMHSAKGLLQHLTEVEKCSQKAHQVIAVLRGVKPAEADAAAAASAASSATAAAAEAPAAYAPAPEVAAAAAASQDLLGPAETPKATAAKGAQDLLDFPVQAATAPRNQAVSDLLDFTAAPPVTAAPVGDLLASSSMAPAVTTAPLAAVGVAAPATAPVSAAAPAGLKTANLADLYALYPQSNSVPSAPAGFPAHTGPSAHMVSKDAAFQMLPNPGMGGAAAAAPGFRATPMQMGMAMRSERPNQPAPKEAAAHSPKKEQGLESLLSDAVAGLGNLGVAAH